MSIFGPVYFSRSIHPAPVIHFIPRLSNRRINPFKEILTTPLNDAFEFLINEYPNDCHNNLPHHSVLQTGHHDKILLLPLQINRSKAKFYTSCL